jgi:hypothetical protein
MSLKCPVASKVAKPSLLFDWPCWLDQHAILSTWHSLGQVETWVALLHVVVKDRRTDLTHLLAEHSRCDSPGQALSCHALFSKSVQ